MAGLETPVARIATGAAGREHRRPDTLALTLWAAATLVAAMALPAANWTDDLGLVPMTATLGLALGVLLTVSRFTAWAAGALGAGYGAAVVLLQVTATLDPAMAWRERALDLGNRIAIFLIAVVSGERSYDSLMFVLAMALVFWITAVFGTWWLFRRRGLWPALLPPGASVFLNVYYYRFGERLQIYLPVFLLILLALIARLELLRRQRSWEEARAQIPSDIAGRITTAGAVAALALVGVAWLLPQVPETQFEPAGSAAGGSAIGDLFSDAFAGLRSPVNLYGEAFADSVSLGPGQDPGSRAIFQATPRDEIPPGSRPYWRARVFDTYQDGTWSTAVGEEDVYRARQAAEASPAGPGRVEVEFLISPFVPAMRLLVLPSQPVWFNRTAEVRQVVQGDQVVEVLEAISSEILVPGDSYRVRSHLATPFAGDLRKAGQTYPAWVRQAYLQLPADLPDSIATTAAEITRGAPTPYDKAVAITAWLRSTIRYQRVTEAPPPGRDPVDWFLVDSRVGFCDYYTSAMVLMLRAAGVPARMAAGYAAGAFDPEENRYFVSAAESHSWPEVYFPGYGWVEFEPTVSQPPLERPEGTSAEGPTGGAAGGDSLFGEGAAAGGGDPALSDLLEDIEIPEAAAPAGNWLGIVVAAAGVVAGAMVLRSARSAVGRVALRISRRLSLPAPRLLQQWATPPPTEAASVFRRLSAWSGRLRADLAPNATAHERARAIEAELPPAQDAVEDILRWYSEERYGGRAVPAGAPTRAWRTIRLKLVRLWLVRALDRMLYGAEA